MISSVFKAAPFWWEDAPPQSENSQNLPSSADVVIIGSGYAGLCCAIELARRGTDVVVLDAGAIGGGASTRAAGFTSGRAGVSKQINLEAAVGPVQAQRILEEADEAHLALQAFIENEQIDCDFTASGRFVGAHTKTAYDKLAAKTAEYQQGAPSDFEMISQSEQDRFVQTDSYCGGVFIRNAGSIHPAKYHAGLVCLARRAGVTLVSHNRVLGLKKAGTGHQVETESGVISAAEVVLGTGGYTDKSAPYHRRRIIPMSSTIIATEPIGAERVSALLPAGCPVIDSKRVLNFIRPSPDGTRILFGGRARFTPISAERSVAILHQQMQDYYPQLASARITHSWSGLMAFTFDFLPKIGVHDGVHYALACNGGSGIVMMSWLGRQTAFTLLGGQNSKSAFAGLAYKSHPLYSGWPWFIPFVGTYYRFRDWLDLRLYQ